MDAAGKVELAASAMIVDAGNDGYTVRRIVYNGNGADDSVGSGNIYCESNGSISDITDATKKQEYFDSLINVMGLGSLTLSSANGTPLQLVYDASGNLQENDGSGNETMIILSKGGKKRVKLTYKSGGWEISEKY
jgi:YD repeat-containing protein